MPTLADQEGRALRRAAKEVKRYRVMMKVVPILLAVLALLLVLIYIVTSFYNKYGSFTVTVSKYDFSKYSLSLCETPDFRRPSSRLNAGAAENVTNISGATLPADIDQINGQHNGENYVAYTFYCRNAGSATVDISYRLYLANMTQGIEKAIRVRLYVDGTPVTYARTASDGSGPEPDTVEFLSATTVTEETVQNFAPEDTIRFTVVIWIEGDDPDCLDSVIGGEIKVDMAISIATVGE